MKQKIFLAKQMLTDGGYTAVVINGDKSYVSRQRGVAPLLSWLEEKDNFKGAVAADKVVGKAAAYLYVLLGVSALYADVISEHALTVLKKHGIEAEYHTLTPAIVNRTGDGFCPMESAVVDIDTPHEALDAIKAKISELKKQQGELK